MDLVKIWTICSSNGIVLDADMRDNITRFAKEVKYWNSKVNMISRKDEDNIFVKHILHSLLILKYYDPKLKAKVLDIGTGGGFPGIPVKIARPDLRMHLIDSISKKAKLTEMFAKHTGLNNISVHNGRVEELNSKIDIKFDLVIARAVAPINKLFYWSKDLITEKTKYFLLKGGDLSEEIKEFNDSYKNYSVHEIIIDVLGVDDFKKDEKKLLIIQKK